MQIFTIKCPTCGRIEDIIISEMPDFISEFYKLLTEEGLYPVYDIMT